MRWNKTLALFFCLATVSVQASHGATPDNSEKLIQSASKLIEDKPLLAEKELSTINQPYAKALRAYLYFTKKVPAENSSAMVDRLMHEAITQASDKSSLGDIDANKKYHYTDLTMLLTHLRFIADADGAPAIPNSIFRYYPIAAFEAFAPYWGSSRDGWLRIEDYASYDVEKIPEVGAFTKLLGQLFGDPADTCIGTMRYMYYRIQNLALLQASLGPTMFLPGVKAKGAKDFDPDLNDFMEVWSNEQIWNKVKYKEYMLSKGRAQSALQVYYAKRLKLDSNDAAECSKNAVETMCSGYLDQYSHSTMKETRDRPIYKVCTRPGVSAAVLEKGLAGQTLSKEDLIAGLRYCILNGGDASAIEWLISKGAPVEVAPIEGAPEPALFAAVLRPEIVDALIKAGAKAKAANQVGKTALFQAVQFDSLESVKRLHAAGADITKTMVAVDSDAANEANSSCAYNYTVGSRTPLHYAAMFASAPVIQYLLDKGASKTAKDSSGTTPEALLSGNKNLSATERETIKKALQSAK